ncbi:MAG: hypothetical protein HYZ49_14675 [Chloroflexi bacterium]|nr:hypothetical protein [Chloroflexota bacterium]
MNTEGPLLETLTRRLAECPADFLAEPRLGRAGAVHVAAVVADLIRDLGGEPLTQQQVAAFQSSNARLDRNRLRLVLVTCWLLRDSWFTNRQQFSKRALNFLVDGLTESAKLTPAPNFVNDPDRREELSRLCLSALGLRPAGETLAQAQDRLSTLDTAERQRVMTAARAAEERAREIRRKMAEEAAREAEMKTMRE